MEYLAELANNASIGRTTDSPTYLRLLLLRIEREEGRSRQRRRTDFQSQERWDDDKWDGRNVAKGEGSTANSTINLNQLNFLAVFWAVRLTGSAWTARPRDQLR